MQVECFIHASWSKYSKSFNYIVYSSDMTAYGYVLLEKRALEFNSPTENALKVLAARALGAKRNKVLADAMLEANEIQAEVDELLCLEDKSVSTEQDDGIPF